jgi:hypothetical protein
MTTKALYVDKLSKIEYRNRYSFGATTPKELTKKIEREFILREMSEHLIFKVSKYISETILSGGGEKLRYANIVRKLRSSLPFSVTSSLKQTEIEAEEARKILESPGRIFYLVMLNRYGKILCQLIEKEKERLIGKDGMIEALELKIRGMSSSGSDEEIGVVVNRHLIQSAKKKASLFVEKHNKKATVLNQELEEFQALKETRKARRAKEIASSPFCLLHSIFSSQYSLEEEHPERLGLQKDGCYTLGGKALYWEDKTKRNKIDNQGNRYTGEILRFTGKFSNDSNRYQLFIPLNRPDTVVNSNNQRYIIDPEKKISYWDFEIS